MKKLSFKKVGDNGRQRFYQLSQPVTKVCYEGFDWEKEREYSVTRLKEQYKELLPDVIEYVAVSDAHTHVERLVFVAMPLNKEKTNFSIASSLHIDGKHTMMIHGGSYRHVHPDEVYLRRLARVNGFTFEMEGV
jgi:hypothetical protein